MWEWLIEKVLGWLRGEEYSRAEEEEEENDADDEEDEDEEDEEFI